MIDYPFKTQPRGKQADVLRDTWNWPIAAFLCRPGTGKTKLGLDTAGMNFMAGRIDALFVISPDGVDRQWLTEGVPVHLSDAVPRICGNYRSQMGERAYKNLCKDMMQTHHDGKPALRILTMSFDGLQTPRGKRLARWMAGNARYLCIDDESHRTANKASAVHRALKPIMRAARVKRIATGTLVRQNPFSIWGQFDLMGDALLGFSSLASFKSMYAQMLPADDRLVLTLARNLNRRGKDGKLIAPNIIAKDEDDRPIYRNLADLRRRLAQYSVFLTLADVNGTEPVVNQNTRYVELSEVQRTMYNDLVKWGVAQAPGGQLTAEGSLALSIRLAQVAGGFSPSDDDPAAKPIGAVNPKVENLLELADELGGDKLVIWCKFTAEIIAVVKALTDKYGAAAVTEYHGRMTSKEKDISKRRFIDDAGCRFFVGQQKAGGTGLDGLQGVGHYMAVFSNDYPYVERLQAISRLARTNGADVVQVWDIVAERTIDEDIANVLRSAQDVSESVLGKAIVRKWD
jgi:SNF2 family DNA or RNA helicase